MINTTTTSTQRALSSALSTASKALGQVPARLEVARKEGARLGVKGMRQLKKHPVSALIAAGAIALAAIKIARRR